MVALVMKEVIDNLGVTDINGLGFHLLIGREKQTDKREWTMLYYGSIRYILKNKIMEILSQK
jgi:hypothetical protein